MSNYEKSKHFSQSDASQLFNKIHELKMQLKNALQRGDSLQEIENKVMSKIRIFHGRIAYINHIFIEKIEKKIKENKEISDEQWITLSHYQMASLKMAKIIKKHRMMTHGQCMKNYQGPHSKDSHMSTYARNENTRTIIRKNSEGIDELSVKSINEESPFDIFYPSGLTGGSKLAALSESNLTEYIDNMEEDDYEHLEQMYGGHHDQMNKYGNIDTSKPVAVLYWADWCPFSTKFLTKWKEFQAEAKGFIKSKNLDVNIQMTDINIGQNQKLHEAFRKSGGKGLPTVVLYYRNKPYAFEVSGKEMQVISKYIMDKIAELSRK